MNTKGFIDLHTHGVGKYDTRTDSPDDILKMAGIYKKAGTDAILPTIYSASISEMRKNMEAVRQAMQAQKSKRAKVRQSSSLIFGVHLEGPFLNPLRAGALNKRSFIKPTISSLNKLIDGYEDIIKIITIAPEMQGALKLIEKCAGLGIKVNMGHSDATYKQAVDGMQAGATGITHLFNAMRPFHHREPGLAGLGLLHEYIYIEVIADGIHLHTKTIELVFATKRLDRIIIVSDSVKGAGRSMPAHKSKGVLAGSRMTIADSVKVLKDIKIPDAEIIEATVDNPRRYIS